MKCSENVMTRGLNFPRMRQCKNKATVEVDGKFYCSIHNPNRVKKERKNKKIDMTLYYHKLKNVN